MNKDMAQIPYVAHLARMHKAYKRETRLKALLVLSNKKEIRLKVLLVLSNVMWAVICLVR